SQAVVYQGFVRPQLDLQSQIQSQERQIDRVLTTGETPGLGTGLGGHSSASSASALAASPSALGSPTLDRLRGTTNAAARVDAGHPVYFQYRDQYFPGFKRRSGGGNSP